MKKYFKHLREDKLLGRLYVAAFFLIAVTAFYIFASYQKLPPLLPVFNQLPWGEERLAQTPGIFIPGGVVFAILIFNVFASEFSYLKSPLISRMFAVTTFLIALLTLLFVIRVVGLIS